MRFPDSFPDELARLMRLRRDTRRFRTDPVPDTVLERCLDCLDTAPSVGLSQPWRLVSVASPGARQSMRDIFRDANATALSGYDGEQARLYAGLKLSGMDRAPVQWAVFCDEATEQGSGLGAQSMPEMRRYSVVCAVMQMWLAARAQGLGMGWVSILDPLRVREALALPGDWRLVAYLCLGWPETEETAPELERLGWEHRRPRPALVLR
ncbi:5,6-dimethylbenzimidazole synthase [Poseidonocella sp. HB161398]|uniref:5,6-dimethylbenzimidazole synthase n=1 Tax=Poseidonocella sp. HB161398 TaxID=2320855 RepID=UPI00110866B3|nr:5,6-dimethylbenzimidazole synthase [Poseidonocella sp. HB161398]